RSAHGWDVPPLVRDAARSYTEIGEAGHLMMMEQPDAYCRAVEACIPAA
ncbi:MAG: alpha/beta hydrolase, partial [Planctomycetes bacterium]|nr:alpha/beta hydrolase [Planctomycetota bacterium]